MQPLELPTVEISDVTHALGTGQLVLDVREPDEWAAGHIDGAVHVPMNQVPDRLQAQPDLLDAEAPVLVICKGGGRSAQVTAWLRAQGYDAKNVGGGMLAWAGSRQPMTCEHSGDPFVA